MRLPVIKNGRNGLALKILVGVLTAGLVGATGGMLQLWREVGILQADSHTQRRLDALEKLSADIATDRDKRTIIIQGFRDEINELKRRIEQLERRR